MQQGDVLLFQTDDDGEIIVENGLVEMSGGLETMAYLAMFGGNEDDDGRPNNPANWWGNFDEIDPAKQYRSETQNLIQALPASTGNLRRIEKAAERDLAVFTEKNIASFVSVAASIPGINRIKIAVKITANGVETSFNFVENWKVST